MAARTCRQCGRPVPPTDRYCGQCGARFVPARSNVPLGTSYWGFRFQIDPMYPPPRRDVRYTMIVVGMALTILALLLIAVSAIISDAISASASTCSSGPCSTVDPGPWFLWIALPFLGLGVALLVVGVWWGIRPLPVGNAP